MKVKAPFTNEVYEILSREEIQNIITSLAPENIVRTAHEGYIPGIKTGYAAVNLVTGELESKSLQQNEHHTGVDALWVAIYKIGPNPPDWPMEEIYTDEEIRTWKNSEEYEEGICIDEFHQIDPIEIYEREIEAEIYHFNLDWEWINDQLDRWYVEVY
ncbi:hypothetical protein CathTA2_0829 [Caldalkalibacillus thermarum TA2.A1]|nr:hypothetical protein [Caldalkalibacillus thermarum]EGL83618.1 hypothetical protein CathTA2_0829 [Caldalkalibacillus thermarum TA2.A1]